MATVSFMLPDEFHSAIIQHKRAWWACPASACQVGLARDQQYWGADVWHSTTLACLPLWDLICALLVYDSGGIVVHIWHLASLGVSNAKIKPSHSWDNPTHNIKDICIELSGDRRRRGRTSVIQVGLSLHGWRHVSWSWPCWLIRTSGLKIQSTV